MEDLFKPLIDRIVNSEAHKKAKEKALVEKAAETLCRKIALSLEVILDEGETNPTRIYGEVGMYGVPPHLHSEVRQEVVCKLPSCIQIKDGDPAFADSIIYKWSIDENRIRALIEKGEVK